MGQVVQAAAWSITEEIPPPDGVSEPAWNMGLDAFNLDCVLENRSIPRMRLYQWSGPAITLGRFQEPERSLNKEVCRSLEIPIARRPTGGRGILHGSDLTVSLAASLERLGLTESTSISDIYGSLSATLMAAFAAVGLHAERGGCSKSDRWHSADCMATVSRADVVSASAGDKLLGAALLRRSGCVLFQCTIPANTQSARFREVQSSVFQGLPRVVPATLPVVPLNDMSPAIAGEMQKQFSGPPMTLQLSAEEIQRSINRSLECQVAL